MGQTDPRDLIEAATPLPWYAKDGELSWQLFGADKPMGLQILKAPKQHPHQAEYWPKPTDAALIVYAVNHLPALLDVADALERLLGEAIDDLLAESAIDRIDINGDYMLDAGGDDPTGSRARFSERLNEARRALARLQESHDD